MFSGASATVAGERHKSAHGALTPLCPTGAFSAGAVRPVGHPLSPLRNPSRPFRFRSNEGRLSGVVLPLSSRNRQCAFRPLRSVGVCANKVRYVLPTEHRSEPMLNGSFPIWRTRAPDPLLTLPLGAAPTGHASSQPVATH